MRRGNLRELSRRLTEVEHVGDALTGSIGRSKPAEIPYVFDEAYDAAELIDRFRNVTALAAFSDLNVRRNNEHRHAKTDPALIVQRRRRYRIVKSTPIVPNNDDNGGIPIFALPDGIDDACDPRRARVFFGVTRMV